MEHFSQDQDTFTVDDGTGRGSVVFEFDTDGLPSDAFISEPERIIDSNNTGKEGILLLDGQYLSTESRSI